MLSIILAVCTLATSNVEVQFSTPPPETSGLPSYSGREDSDITPSYVIDDVSFATLRATYAGKPRRKSGGKRHGKGGYLRARSKYRNSHQRDASSDKYSNEYWIKRMIMTKYDRKTIPASRNVRTVPLYVGMSLFHILDTVITARI